MRYLASHRSRSCNVQSKQFGFVSIDLLVIGTTVAFFACLVLGIAASSSIDSIVN